MDAACVVSAVLSDFFSDRNLFWQRGNDGSDLHDHGKKYGDFHDIRRWSHTGRDLFWRPLFSGIDQRTFGQ